MTTKKKSKHPRNITKLINVRLSFPSLFEPTDYKDDKKFKFRGHFMLDPKNALHAAQIKKLRLACVKLIKAEWGPKAKLPASDICIVEGNAGNAEGVVRDEYKDMWIVTASNPKRPLVLDRDKSKLDASSGKPEGGDYVNANVILWAQNNDHGKRINANLVGVQFHHEGEKFGEGIPDADEQFDDLTDDSDVLDDDDYDDLDDILGE